MALEALDDGGAFPLGPNDVHLVEGLEERVVRKGQPGAPSEDGFHQLVVVACLIHPEFEGQRGLVRGLLLLLGQLRWLDDNSSFFCGGYSSNLRYCSVSITFWVGPQEVQCILAKGGSNSLIHGAAQMSLGDMQELFGPNVPIEFVDP